MGKREKERAKLEKRNRNVIIECALFGLTDQCSRLSSMCRRQSVGGRRQFM